MRVEKVEKRCEKRKSASREEVRVEKECREGVLGEKKYE